MNIQGLGSAPNGDVEAFRRQYEDDSSHWGKHSGGGSDPYHTSDYRLFLEKFLKMNNIRSVVDIGCGDWQFSRFINYTGVAYTGLDIVPSVIETNIARFSSQHTKFGMMPAELSAVPTADLLIMKDVLQHLPDAVVFEFIKVVLPKYKVCLLTNSYIKLNAVRNVDIKAGDFRCLDLASAPYNLDGGYVLEFGSPLWERIRTFLYKT